MSANNPPKGSEALQIDPELWDRTMEIHRAHIVLNLGVMSSMRLIQPGRDIGWRWQGREDPDLAYAATAHLDLPRVREGAVNVLGMMACAPARTEADAVQSPLRGLEHIDLIYSDVIERYSDEVQLALSMDDVRGITASGKIAVILGMQAADMLGGSTRALKTFHRLGVQYITLTHAWSNDLIDSSTGKERWGGLSERGREIVLEMNRVGVVPDITHASDKGSAQVLELSRGPVIASHSNCRSLCDHLGERNMSDDLIRALAATGGVISLNFSPRLIHQGYADAYPRFLEEVQPLLRDFMKELEARYHGDLEQQYDARVQFLAENGIPYPTHEDIVDHVEHVVHLVGWDHIGIGSDFDGTGLLERHMEDVSKIPLLTYELLRRGHRKEDIVKFLGENMLRVFVQTREIADGR